MKMLKCKFKVNEGRTQEETFRNESHVNAYFKDVLLQDENKSIQIVDVSYILIETISNGEPNTSQSNKCPQREYCITAFACDQTLEIQNGCQNKRIMDELDICAQEALIEKLSGFKILKDSLVLPCYQEVYQRFKKENEGAPMYDHEKNLWS